MSPPADTVHDRTAVEGTPVHPDVRRWFNGVGTRLCLKRFTEPAPVLAQGCSRRSGYWTRCGVLFAKGYQWFHRGAIMSDKSPRQHMAKKQGKTIKEKRADKKDKAKAAASLDHVSRVGKR